MSRQEQIGVEVRDRNLIKQCKSKYGHGHVGPFYKLNNMFVKCDTCKGILGIELVRGRDVIETNNL